MSEHDNDGDSQMLSSSSSSSEHMFPTSTADDPPTPRNNASFPSYQDHALSPPDSQNTTLYNPEHASIQEAMDVEAGGGGEMGEMDDFLADGQMEEKKEPGWSWKNRKAMEEYSKAMEMVVDKGFSLREFGDLYDEREERTEG